MSWPRASTSPRPTARSTSSRCPGFVGPAKPVTYRVADSNGTTATATLTITVALPAKPVANPDIATTPQNVSIALTPLANDRPAPGVTFDAAFGRPARSRLGDGQDDFKKKVVVPGEGTYDGQSRTVASTSFRCRSSPGSATTLGYRVTDSTGQLAESTLAVTVTPVTPKAAGDSVIDPVRHERRRSECSTTTCPAHPRRRSTRPA